MEINLSLRLAIRVCIFGHLASTGTLIIIYAPLAFKYSCVIIAKENYSKEAVLINDNIRSIDLNGTDSFVMYFFHTGELV